MLAMQCFIIKILMASIILCDLCTFINIVLVNIAVAKLN